MNHPVLEITHEFFRTSLAAACRVAGRNFRQSPLPSEPPDGLGRHHGPRRGRLHFWWLARWPLGHGLLHTWRYLDRYHRLAFTALAIQSRVVAAAALRQI